MRALTFAVLVSLSAAPAAAQEEGELPATFTSDRPGFVDSTTPAARGRLTMELGVVGGFTDVATSLSLPSLRLRTGFFGFLEARLMWDGGQVLLFDGEPATYGLGDLTAGLKMAGPIADGAALAFVVDTRLPSGTDAFRAADPEVTATLNLSWSFWGPLGFYATALAAVVTDEVFTGGLDSSRVTRTGVVGGAVQLQWQLVSVLTLFVEGVLLFSERDDVPNGEPVIVRSGGGLMWRVAPHWQLDVSVDASLTNDLVPTQVGLGTTALF